MKKMLSKIKCLLVFLKEGTSSRVGGGSVRIQAGTAKTEPKAQHDLWGGWGGLPSLGGRLCSA